MSIWAEAHDLPHIANAGKKIAWLPVLSGQFGKHADAFREEGSMRLPVAYSRLGEVFNVNPDDHSEDVGSVVHVYQKGVVGDDGRPNPVFSFVPERRPDELESPATGDVQFSGRGLTSYFLDRVNLLPYDSPANPSQQPDWNFGETDDGGNVENGSFENDGFPNGGFELGNDDHWNPTVATDVTRASTIAVATGSDARSGDYYGVVFPHGSGKSGMRRSISGLIVGKPYIITGWVKDPSSVRRFRAGVNGASSAFHTNNYEQDGYWWAELGNATQGNGNSNGSYQQFVIQFYAASTSVDLVIICESASNATFFLDDWACAGFGLGVGPWEPFSLAGSTHNTFERSENFAQDGDAALAIQGNARKYTDPFGRQSWGSLGVIQYVRTTPNRKHSGSAWFYHESGTTQQFWLIWKRSAVQTSTFRESNRGLFPFGTWIHSTAVNVPSGVWTKAELSAVIDVPETVVEIVWRAADVSVPDSGSGINSPTFYIDNVKMWEGEPATTIGDMWGRFLDKTDGLDWLVPSFTATHDSDGQAWDKARALSLREGQSLGQIAESLQNLFGYVHRIRYDREDNTYYFDIYNPGYVAFDHSTTDTGMLVSGMNIHGGEVVTRSPGATVIRGVLDSGAWSETEDAGLKAAWGRADQRLDLGEISEMDDAIEAIGVSLNRTKDEMVTFQAEGTDTGQVVPFAHYDIFHKVGVNLGAKSGIPVGDRIVTSMVCSWKPGQRPQVQTFVNSDAFASSGMAALAEAVRRLLRRPERKQREKLGIAGGGGEGGGQVSVVVAASDASEISKSKADFVCTGTNDQQVINKAIDLLGFVGGQVVLTEGTYRISIDPSTGYGIDLDVGGVSLVGLNHGLTIIVDDSESEVANGMMVRAGSGAVISDLWIEANWAAHKVIGTRVGTTFHVYILRNFFESAGGECVFAHHPIAWWIEGNYFEMFEIDEQPCIRMRGWDNWIIDNVITGGLHNIKVEYVSGVGLLPHNFHIQRNFLWSPGYSHVYVDVSAAGVNSSPDYFWITDNFMQAAGMTAGTEEDEIGAIHFEGVTNTTGEGGFGTGITGNFIHRNIMDGAAIVPPIKIVGTPAVSIMENQIAACDGHYVWLIDSPGCSVKDNKLMFPTNAIEPDAIRVEGDSNFVRIQDNDIISDTTPDSFGYFERGIHIVDSTCDECIVVGNAFYGIYVTDALVNNGTGTILTYPNDPTYGDNFVN